MSSPAAKKVAVSDLERRVLILAPFGRDASLLAGVLQQAGIEAEACLGMPELCAEMEKGTGAILVADEALPTSGVKALAAVIERQPPWSDLPVFVMVSSDQLHGRSRLLQLEPLGNVTMLERPLRTETVVSSFRMGLRARAHQYQLRDHFDAERRAAAALRESEDHYRTAVDLNPQVPWTASPQGDIEDFGPKWLELTGLTRKQVLVDGWINVTPAVDREAVRRAWQHSLTTGEPYDVEHRIVMADGSLQWMRSRARPRRGDDGTIIRWYGSTENIHQTKLGEEQLRTSEARYRTLAQALPQLVWTCSPAGECDYLSPQWLDYTGLPEQDQLGYQWLNVAVHPDDRQGTAAAWSAATNGGATYDAELRLRRSDGTYRWFKSCATPVRDSSGKVARWFGTCTDIEEQKRALAERQDLLDRERQARSTAELLNRVGPSLLLELDTRRLSQRVTDLATQLTQAAYGALLHCLSDDPAVPFSVEALSAAVAHPADSHPFAHTQDLFCALLEGSRMVRADDVTKDPRFSEAMQHHSAKLRVPITSFLAAPVFSRSGGVTGWMIFGHEKAALFSGMHEDLAAGIAAQAAIALDNARLFSEARQAQETLRRSNVELRRANEDLNQFAYSASHDLQEPLRMVSIYSQMLQRKYKLKLDADANEYINYTVQGAHRMEMLLKDLLEYTQVVDHVEEEADPIEAGKVLGRAIENLAQTIDETGAAIETSQLPLLKVKEVHLLQLFQNLIGNSLKYRGEAKPVIQVYAQREAKMWSVCIRDNGIGIDPQYARQVFGLFKRLHGGSSPYEGTGIGLAICQKIVQRYGGSIWVESKGEGTGSTFYFTLPAAA